MVPRDLSSETQNMRCESIWPKQPNRAPPVQVPQKGEVPSLRQKPSQFRLLRISLPSGPKKKKQKAFLCFLDSCPKADLGQKLLETLMRMSGELDFYISSHNAFLVFWLWRGGGVCVSGGIRGKWTGPWGNQTATGQAHDTQGPYLKDANHLFGYKRAKMRCLW